MVEATPRAMAAPRQSARICGRALLRWSSVAADVVAILTAYLAALAVHALAAPATGLPALRLAPFWALVLQLVAILSVFYASGLYELESYVSRPLHLWVLLRASLIAFAISAVSVYVISPSALNESRVAFLWMFVSFVLIVCLLRLGAIDGLYVAWTRRRRPVCFLLGDSEGAAALADRLSHLRGFNRVAQVAPSTLRLGMPEALVKMLEGSPSMDDRTASIFIDASSGTPREVFEAAAAGQALGAEVYVVSKLIESLEGTRLLSRLFDAPVVRVRRSIDDAKPYMLKRVLDIVGSAVLLILTAPIMMVLGVVIRLTSPGPVFYEQTRVRRFGVPFEFLKLRSMVLNHDSSIHSDYVRAFMNGTAEAVATGNGDEAVFKKIDDPRITPIGRFIRKYSFDELPQFWNVFRGEMSLVGPRPPLPYEVKEYNDWHKLRLSVPSGVTGPWQVEGRSRVSFEEMVLQDVMYAQNMRLLLDVKLCLMTVPAALFGDGGG